MVFEHDIRGMGSALHGVVKPASCCTYAQRNTANGKGGNGERTCSTAL